MDEQLKQIGERLRGLRDVLDIPVSEMAETIGMDTEKYEKIEAGELDITISNLMKIAHKYGVSTEELVDLCRGSTHEIILRDTQRTGDVHRAHKGL